MNDTAPILEATRTIAADRRNAFIVLTSGEEIERKAMPRPCSRS